MQQARKVEIIISNLELREVIDILDNLRVPGYTVVKNTSGKDDHGESNDDLDRVFSNSSIMAICTNEKQLNYLIDDVTPLLKKLGGMCLVSNIVWLNH